MQKVFGWLERLLVGIAVIGSVLILSSTSGGAGMLVLSLGFLSLLYFLGGYFQPVQTEQKFSVKVALVKVLSGFTLSVLVIGLLFKLMVWSGAAVMLLIGICGTVVVAIIAFALTHAEYNVAGILRRSAIWSGLGAVLFLTSSTTLFALHNPDDPVLIEKFKTREAHPDDPAIQSDFDNYRRQQLSHQPAK
jgi:hypothetical protein